MSSQNTGQSRFRKDLLRRELERTGKRAVHIAVDLDVDPRTVTRWLSDADHVFPNGSNCRRLERYFGRDRDWFFRAENGDPDPDLPIAA